MKWNRKSPQSKKNLCVLLLSAILLASCFFPLHAGAAGKSSGPARNQAQAEMRGVWFSFLNWQQFLKGKTEPEMKAAFSQICDVALAQGCNAIFMHVRSHNDAVYPSGIYPWSTQMLGGNPGFDPLADFVSIAHAKGLAFHAWINPYGYRKGGYSGDPSLVSVANIVAGIQEILIKYPVDGIHFDDYFPPLGTSVHNEMIRQVYALTHRYGKIFGISPTGNVENNIKMGADVGTWLSTPGYLDYICPQLYWTNQHGKQGNDPLYTRRLQQWIFLNKLGLPMFVGLASYRCGEKIPGDPGWQLRNTNLYEQALSAKKAGLSGYLLFDYASLLKPAAQNELANLRLVK